MAANERRPPRVERGRSRAVASHDAARAPRGDAGGPARRQDERKLYGVHACLAQHRVAPESVVRLYLRKDRLGALRPLVEHCTKNRLVYRLVLDEELERIAASKHHEGVCLVIREPEGGANELPNRDGCVLVLDGVENPHNIGALLRSGAHFGASSVIVCGVERLSGATHRVAQGGAQALHVLCWDRNRALREITKAGFQCYVCSSHAGVPIDREAFPARSAFVLGNEQSGAAPAWAKAGARALTIAGTGAVESLNVAAAGAVVLAEYFRQTRLPKPV